MMVYLSEEEIKKTIKLYLEKKVVNFPMDEEVILRTKHSNGNTYELNGELFASVDVGGEK